MAQNQRLVILAVLLVVALIGASAYFYATGAFKTEETACCTAPPADRAVAVDKTPAAPPVRQREAGEFEPAAEAPLTLTALKYMPEQAQVALGIPPATSLLARYMPFIQEFIPGLNLQEELDLIASDLAVDMEVSDEGGLAGVLSAMGIDSGAGMAVFLDLSEAAQVLAESVASGDMDELPDMSSAKGLLVIPVNDGKKAEDSLLKLGGDLLSGMEISEEEVNGITIKMLGDMAGYFVSDTILAVSNSKTLLEQAVTRAASPAVFQYGSTLCPPDDVHEAVALVFADRLMPMLDLMSEKMAELEPTVQVLVSAQMEKLRHIYGSASPQDPMIITARVDETAVELKTKIDTAVYPELAEYMGAAYPLRLAQLLPPNTRSFLSLCFNEEAKAQIKDVYLESIPEEVKQRPGVSQGIMYSDSAFQLLGGEITLGVTGFEPIGFPSVFLMVQIANTPGAQILLQMAPQVDHDAPYRDVQVKALGVPFYLPIYFVLVNDALILSNSDEGIRGVIDLIKDGQTSGFFEKLNPPIPPDAPIYQAFLIKPSLYTEIVEPLAPLAGRSLPSEAEDAFSTAARLFEDIRFLNEMQGSWSVSRLFALRRQLP